MTVIVGMSGGVDSSVSAFLLKQQGYKVIGLFMKNWEETDAEGRCCASREYEDVARVCDQLEIPHYSVNFVEEYREAVFSHFLEELKAGLTPNPDILCNREIKFNAFLKKAFEIGGDFLATGHYCRLDDQKRLLKGSDPAKDQSYFLYAVKREALQRVLFPVGHLNKQEVRAIAKREGLATAEKKDSTGICFIGERRFTPFLKNYLGIKPGKIQTGDGTVVGEHEGLAYHTIGQRRGIGLGGEGEPWFVVGKDLERNILLVERGTDHPALFSSSIRADQLTWMEEPTLPKRCSAKIRYRQQDQTCTIVSIENGMAAVIFDQPQRAATPGQSIVFYEGDLCLGGGVIQTGR